MNKNKNGNLNNTCGVKICKLRLIINPPLSQRALADQMQLNGIDLDKKAIQRIESSKRFIETVKKSL